MTVTLPKDLETFVQNKVQLGDYDDANELICDALRQLREQEHDWNQDSPELKAFLLEAVRGAHRPLQLEELEEMERCVLATETGRCH